MNDYTYYLLADVSDGAASSLVSWHHNIRIARRSNDADTRQFVIGSVASLLDQDALGVGSYAEEAPHRWQRWFGSTDELVERLTTEYLLRESSDPDPFEWNCYLANTPIGDAAFESERRRRLTSGLDPMARLDGIWPTRDGDDPEVEL